MVLTTKFQGDVERVAEAMGMVGISCTKGLKEIDVKLPAGTIVQEVSEPRYDMPDEHWTEYRIPDPEIGFHMMGDEKCTGLYICAFEISSTLVVFVRSVDGWNVDQEVYTEHGMPHIIDTIFAPGEDGQACINLRGGVPCTVNKREIRSEMWPEQKKRLEERLKTINMAK